MATPFLEPDAQLIPEDGRWFAECRYCEHFSLGDDEESALSHAREHHDEAHGGKRTPPSDLRGSDLMSRLIDPTSGEYQWAVDAVGEYFTSYTGRMFERLRRVNGADPTPNEVTPLDLVAVTMLGVQIPAAASIRILGSLGNDITDILSDVPDTHLHRAPDELGRGQPAWRLWDLLMTVPGLGPTKVSKLLSRKRTHLIPIHDQRVTWRLQLPQEEWEYFTRWWLQDRNLEGIARLTDDVGGLTDISLLRVLDVAVWRYDEALRPNLR